MGDVCFSPPSLALLVTIGGLLQTVIVTLFWLAIRSKDDSIKDARELRDRALDINETLTRSGERQVEQVGAVLAPRGRR